MLIKNIPGTLRCRCRCRHRWAGVHNVRHVFGTRNTCSHRVREQQTESAGALLRRHIFFPPCRFLLRWRIGMCTSHIPGRTENWFRRVDYCLWGRVRDLFVFNLITDLVHFFPVTGLKLTVVCELFFSCAEFCCWVLNAGISWKHKCKLNVNEIWRGALVNE